MERIIVFTLVSVCLLTGFLGSGCDNSLGSSELFQLRDVKNMWKGPHLFLAPRKGLPSVLQTNAMDIVRLADDWTQFVARMKNGTNSPGSARIAGMDLTVLKLPSGTMSVDVHPSQLTNIEPDSWSFYYFPNEPQFTTFFRDDAAVEVAELCQRKQIGFIHLLTPGPNVDFDLQGTSIHYLRINRSKTMPVESGGRY